jgi:carbonic anhydrase
LSVFFTKDSGEDINDFFDFQNEEIVDKKMDLSKLLDFSSPLHSYVSGYKGSDTMPPCTPNYCWYLYHKTFTISEDQLQWFINQGAKDGNYRASNLSPASKYKNTFNKGGLVQDQ